MALEIKFEGLDDVAASLKRIGKKAQNEIAIEAIFRGLQPVLARAKRYAQRSEETGNLRESIGVKVRKGKKGRVYARLGPRRKFETTNPDGKGKRLATKYAHLVEFGTSHSAAKPFMRPAWEVEKTRALDIIGDELGKGIKAEALKKKAKRKAKTNG